MSPELCHTYETDHWCSAPLSVILCSYYEEYSSLREKHQDLDNLNFHWQFGLRLGTPLHWPLLSSISNLIKTVQGSTDNEPSVTVIYPSTEIYHSVHDALDVLQVNVAFFAWHELYVAMDRAGKDSRALQRFRHILQKSDLTLFFGAPVGVPEVIDQVRGFCEGCLIVMQ